MKKKKRLTPDEQSHVDSIFSTGNRVDLRILFCQPSRNDVQRGSEALVAQMEVDKKISERAQIVSGLAFLDVKTIF